MVLTQGNIKKKLMWSKGNIQSQNRSLSTTVRYITSLEQDTDPDWNHVNMGENRPVATPSFSTCHLRPLRITALLGFEF